MYINAPPPYRCTFLPRKLIPLFGEKRVGVCERARVCARMRWAGGCSVIITTKEIECFRKGKECCLCGHPRIVLFLCK